MHSNNQKPIGELILIGASVGHGYVNSDVVEGTGFHIFPNADGCPSRAYRTGDLFYLDQDENLCFVGRCDHQIKRSGYRIELQEIEAIVLTTGLIEETVAISFSVANQTMIRLFVYSKKNISQIFIEEQIAKVLPHYMIPDEIIISDSFLKKNPNGKIDRKHYTQLYN